LRGIFREILIDYTALNKCNNISMVCINIIIINENVIHLAVLLA
jgi:hypothetical protein